MYRWYLVYQPSLSFINVMNFDIVGFVTGTFGWGGGRKRFRYAFLQILFGLIFHPSLWLSAETFESWESFLRGLFQGQNQSYQSHSNGIKVTLDSIAVSPQTRGMNVGVGLMKAFEDAASKLGAGYLALGVERDNLAARHLYERCGWNIAREDVGSISISYVKKVAKD